MFLVVGPYRTLDIHDLVPEFSIVMNVKGSFFITDCLVSTIMPPLIKIYGNQRIYHDYW